MSTWTPFNTRGGTQLPTRDLASTFAGQDSILLDEESSRVVGQPGQIRQWHDTENCEICGVQFGYFPQLQRRHHCRVCSKCVCSGCSPSVLALSGWKGPQRACTPCVSDAILVQEAKSRLVKLAQQLHRLHDISGGMQDETFSTFSPTALSRNNSLMATAVSIESSLPALEDLRRTWAAERLRAEQAEAEVRRERQLRQQLEIQVLNAKDFLLSLAERLEAASTGSPSVDGKSRTGDLDEAIKLCEAAAQPLNSKLLKFTASHRPVPGGLRAEVAVQTGDLVKTSDEDEDEEAGEMPQFRVQRRDSLLSLMMTEDSKCNVCNANLGKRFLNPRHHCRICQQMVCSSCSPSTVMLESVKRLERACNLCIVDTEKGPALKSRLAKLSIRLLAVAQGSSFPEAAPGPVVSSLDEAVSLCESALGPLRDFRRKHEDVERLAGRAQAHLEARAMEAVNTSQELLSALGRQSVSASEPLASFKPGSPSVSPTSFVSGKGSAPTPKAAATPAPDDVSFWS